MDPIECSIDLTASDSENEDIYVRKEKPENGNPNTMVHGSEESDESENAEDLYLRSKTISFKPCQKSNPVVLS